MNSTVKKTHEPLHRGTDNLHENFETAVEAAKEEYGDDIYNKPPRLAPWQTRTKTYPI